MRVEGARQASRKTRAVLAAVMAGLLASCTATSGPGFDISAPSYNGGGVAAVMAEVAQSADGVGASGGEDASAKDPSVAVSPEATGEKTPPALLSASSPEAEENSESAAVEPAEAAVDTSAASPGAEPAEDSDASAEDVAATPAEAEDESSTLVAVKTEQKKRGFLASFFSPAQDNGAAPAQTAFAPARGVATPLIEPEPKEETAPLIDLSAKERPIQKASFSGDALPGVRKGSLFEITHKSGIDDDSNVDLYEDEGAPLLMASAAGMARLAPNGLLKQRESVDVACLKPELVRMLKTVERHYGKRMIITSGYRSPSHNKRVRGAKRSQHMYCAAVDVQIPGVSKWELAKLVRSMPGRGGVGTYCHTESVHIDVGPERDWNWRCRRRKS